MLTIDEIKLRKRNGDLSLAANVIGISPGNASQILARPSSKKHQKLISFLSKVITMRETLKNTNG